MGLKGYLMFPLLIQVIAWKNIQFCLIFGACIYNLFQKANPPPLISALVYTWTILALAHSWFGVASGRSGHIALTIQQYNLYRGFSTSTSVLFQLYSWLRSNTHPPIIFGIDQFSELEWTKLIWLADDITWWVQSMFNGDVVCVGFRPIGDNKQDKMTTAQIFIPIIK